MFANSSIVNASSMRVVLDEVSPAVPGGVSAADSLEPIPGSSWGKFWPRPSLGSGTWSKFCSESGSSDRIFKKAGTVFETPIVQRFRSGTRWGYHDLKQAGSKQNDERRL